MSDLDDYNRRMTLGDAAGPPRGSMGDHIAQTNIDASRRNAESASNSNGRSYKDKDLSRWFLIFLAVCIFGLMLAISASGPTAFLGILAFLLGGLLSTFFGIAALLAKIKKR